MFLINLYNFLFGYVTVKVKGAKPERFINILMNCRVKFRDIKKISESELSFKTASRYADKYMFGQIAAKTRTECEIVSKKGVKFFLERHKYRLGLYAGVITGIILIYASTFFIWDIKIVRSDYQDNSEIIGLLEKLGCKNGAYIPKLSASELQTKAILAKPDISWIAVNIKGTVAYVEVKKREAPVIITDRTSPANIVASKTGRITYIEAYEGVLAAESENTVQKGDLLISGAVDSKVSGMRIKHAAGKALAETSRIIEIKIPLKSTVKEYTGHTAVKKNLSVFGRSIRLYLNGKVQMEQYDRIKTAEDVTLFDAVVLPMKIISHSYAEFTEKEINIGEETAKGIALAKIIEIIKTRFEDDENITEIKSANYTEEIIDGCYYMKCEIECIENIAKEMPFDANMQNMQTNMNEETE